MRINEIELQADLYDADTMDRYQAAMQNIAAGAAELEKQKNQPAGERIRKQCELIFACFDTIYGSGTAQQLFGGKCNLKDCLQAFLQLEKESERQLKEMQSLSKELERKQA